MYGKFGTDRRLDFTVVGVTVNQTIRMEGLCKALDTPLVISENFQSFYVEETVLLGADTLAGLDK
jgi:adenylate cyclase